ncbi:restriction endonuclease [Phaeobacter gallaeciensis]|uniref:Restriction endonuclease n=1 Tax=Phaeobacter gallaeciensis TaxID=60890 RepID=A0A366X2D5_9RHOB|nr:DNA adenine methylase [Phaeobacter gallaeciensis]RBW56804.1 restriction endonuclease [Phaeobacter gallaeciensis]
MGSKSKIMGFVLDGINQVFDERPICDLFAGSASLSGAVGQQTTVISNDIQAYSSVLSDTYNKSYKTENTPTAEEIIGLASELVEQRQLKSIGSYSVDMTRSVFDNLEAAQKQFLTHDFGYRWHLFAKNYSGTWWSYEQCLWIDALREVAEGFKNHPIYPGIMSSLMFAMAYASQGTGHYAQYRDAKTDSSFRDILIYRNRCISQYFRKKYDAILEYVPDGPITARHDSTSLDFKDCLKSFSGGTVYADPPYCFVHYSRFYHALETLVLYDFPALQVQRGSVVKGRYRDDRHQSPFCIRSKVRSAFSDLFDGVQSSRSSLVLSYSNTGMIMLDELIEIGKNALPHYSIDYFETDHQHMTMGRKDDRQRSVKEGLLIARL